MGVFGSIIRQARLFLIEELGKKEMVVKRNLGLKQQTQKRGDIFPLKIRMTFFLYGNRQLIKLNRSLKIGYHYFTITSGTSGLYSLSKIFKCFLITWRISTAGFRQYLRKSSLSKRSGLRGA